MIKKILGYGLSLLVIMTPIALSAASVFHKDGSIIEGKVVRNKTREVTLEVSDSKKKTIQRKNILRILYRDDYKAVKYIYTLDKSYLVGHIVEDGPDYYMVRFKLDAPAEIRVPKKQIKFVSKKYLVLEEEYSEITADGKKRWGRFSLLLVGEAGVGILLPEWKDFIIGTYQYNTPTYNTKFTVSPLYQLGFSGKYTLTENWDIAAAYQMGCFYGSTYYWLDVGTIGNTGDDHEKSANFWGISNDFEITAGYSLASFLILRGGIKLKAVNIFSAISTEMSGSPTILTYVMDYSILGMGPLVSLDFSFDLPGALKVNNILSLYALYDSVKLSKGDWFGTRTQQYVRPGFSNRLTIEYMFKSLSLTVFAGGFGGAEFFINIGRIDSSNRKQVYDPRITAGGLIGVKYLLSL